MSIYDRWHKAYPDPTVDVPCKCGTVKRPMYPSAVHPSPAQDGKPAKKGGMRWQVRWEDLEGKACKKNFRIKEGKNRDVHAEAFDADITTKLNQRTYVDPKAGEITLTKFALEWDAARPKKSPRTMKNRRQRLSYIVDLPRPEGARKARRMAGAEVPPIADKPLEILARRPSIIQSWIKWMEGVGLSEEYRSNICNELSAIFAAAIDDEIISRNPLLVKSLARPSASHPSKVTPWTLKQFNAAAAKLAALSPRSEGMIHVGGGAGLRQGEILALAEDRVMFLKRKLRVDLQVKWVDGSLCFDLPKRGKVREIPLSNTLGNRLSEQIRLHAPVSVTLPWGEPDGDPYTAKLLFVAPAKTAWLAETFNQTLWHPARAAAGVPETRENGMHCLRHLFASASLALSPDMIALAHDLGHTDPGFTLKRYGHLMPDAPERTRRSLDAFFSGKIPNPTALELPGEAENPM